MKSLTDCAADMAFRLRFQITAPGSGPYGIGAGARYDSLFVAGAGKSRSQMFEWIQDHQAIFWTLGAASIVVFFGSLLAMPALVIRIRPDYFAHETRPPSRRADQHPVVRRVLRIGKNVLGCAFMLAGIAMLVLPGQGLLTLLVGFLMVDFPGKYRFEKWLVGRRYVLRPINWIRRRARRSPLQVGK